MIIVLDVRGTFSVFVSLFVLLWLIGRRILFDESFGKIWNIYFFNISNLWNILSWILNRRQYDIYIYFSWKTSTTSEFSVRSKNRQRKIILLKNFWKLFPCTTRRAHPVTSSNLLPLVVLVWSFAVLICTFIYPLLIYSTRLFSRSSSLSARNTRLSIRPSNRRTRSTNCWSLYNWSKRGGKMKFFKWRI